MLSPRNSSIKQSRFKKKEGGLIGIILVNLGYLDEPTLVKYLARQAEMVVRSEQQ